jgi:hypothetical protein
LHSDPALEGLASWQGTGFKKGIPLKGYGTKDDAQHTLRLERRAADPSFPDGRIIWTSVAEGKRVPLIVHFIVTAPTC